MQKVLVLENMNCWYKVRWDKERCGVVISVHHEFLLQMEDVLRRSKIVAIIADEIGLTGQLFAPWSSDVRSQAFGFGGAIISLGKQGDFYEYAVPYPKVKKVTSEACVECGGTGRDNERDSDCFHCEKGKKYVYDWHEGYRIGGSLVLLMHALEFPDSETTSGDYQLAEIQLIIGGAGRHGIGATLSPVACTFLNTRTSLHEAMCENAHRAMKQAHERIFGRDKYSNRFGAGLRSEDGQLIFDCPGDACGLYTTNSREAYLGGRGCQMSCHNVDQVGQTLMLLAGLASVLGQIDQVLSGGYTLPRETMEVS